MLPASAAARNMRLNAGPTLGGHRAPTLGQPRARLACPHQHAGGSLEGIASSHVRTSSEPPKGMLDQPCFFDRTSPWRVAPLEYGIDFDGLEGAGGAGVEALAPYQTGEKPGFRP